HSASAIPPAQRQPWRRVGDLGWARSGPLRRDRARLPHPVRSARPTGHGAAQQSGRDRQADMRDRSKPSFILATYRCIVAPVALCPRALLRCGAEDVPVAAMIPEERRSLAVVANRPGVTIGNVGDAVYLAIDGVTLGGPGSPVIAH